MTKYRMLLLALLLTGASCATKKWMASRPLDAGLKQVYKAPFEKVQRAAFDAIVERDFHYKDEDKRWDDRAEKTYVITASKGLSAGSTGQYARVVIQKGDSEQTVNVLVESKAATRDSGAAEEDAAKGILGSIEKRVTAK
ncbi:MAG: hypothetical protein HY293_01945 [Planctomycetes bacterium]|nr:hypothetical protein [Planctomycetota bacterium]